MASIANKNLPVIVIGAGGHAKVVIDALLEGNVEVIGVCGRASDAASGGVLGVPFLCTDDEITRLYSPERVALANGVGSTGNPEIRKNLFDRFSAQGYLFINVIHPRAVIGREVRFGAGVQVFAGAVVQAGVQLGDNCIINTRASVDHDCQIGNHVHVAPGAVLCGNVTVGMGAHIGAGATLVQNTSVLPGVLVRAGSVVTLSNVSPYSDTKTEQDKR